MTDTATLLEHDDTAFEENAEVLQISVLDYAGVPIVLAQGDIDLCTAPSLRQALESACAGRKEPGTVGVDMRQVPFIDSAGLALLVEIRKRFMERCRLALIIQEGSQPERVLRLGRFDTFLQVCHSPDELTGVAAVAA